MSPRKNLYRGVIVALGGLSILLFKRLISLKLTVDVQTAVSAGERLLQSGTNIALVTAHPDDLEFFMGGTIKLLTSQGVKVTMIDVSDGEKGVNRKNLGSVRQQEQQNAAKVLRVSDLEFLHLPDLNLAKEKNLKSAIGGVLQEIKPDLVFAFD